MINNEDKSMICLHGGMPYNCPICKGIKALENQPDQFKLIQNLVEQQKKITALFTELSIELRNFGYYNIERSVVVDNELRNFLLLSRAILAKETNKLTAEDLGLGKSD
jgi:hypothetical protein